MVWGGLRGAVSLSLALLVNANHLIGDKAREVIFMQTVGIVTLTLLINGTTAGLVYKLLQVYPENPFRPMLATQGLRNLHMEMEKVIYKLSTHWFHKNADFDALADLLPNFEDAHLSDGDLVDYKCADLYRMWQEGERTRVLVLPQRLVLEPDITTPADATALAHAVLKSGAKTDMSTPRRQALDPDIYARIGIEKVRATHSCTAMHRTALPLAHGTASLNSALLPAPPLPTGHTAPPWFVLVAPPLPSAVVAPDEPPR